MSDSARRASSTYAVERTTDVLLSHYEKLILEARPRKGDWSARLRKLLEGFVE
jgi:hypothetical protein